MSNKNLDKILNNTDDIEIVSIKNVHVEKVIEKKFVENDNSKKLNETNNEFQSSNFVNIDDEKKDNFFDSANIEDDDSQKITMTKNIGRIIDVPNDAIIQTMGDGKIFHKSFKVKIIGVGGAGNNIIKYVYNSREWPSFVEIKALNTDYIALKNIPELAGSLLLMGSEELRGNGSGGDPEMGKRAAESDTEELKKLLEGTDILVLVAGLGKGTGTGATPIIAQIAKDLGILTIGLFNLPSIGAEGNKTYSNALSGLDKLSYICSGFSTISNDRIISADRERTSIKKAYEDANEYMRIIIDEFINIITNASDVNIDFADIKNFFKNQNGFLFIKVEISDYTKDSIKEAIEEKIEKGYTDIDIIDSQNAIFNFKMNENVPSSILENARSATKEIVKTNDLNIVNGISFSDKYENAEINILLAGKFELGKIIDNNLKDLNVLSSKTQLFAKTEELLVDDDVFLNNSSSTNEINTKEYNDEKNNTEKLHNSKKLVEKSKKKWSIFGSKKNNAPTSKFIDFEDKDY